MAARKPAKKPQPAKASKTVRKAAAKRSKPSKTVVRKAAPKKAAAGGRKADGSGAPGSGKAPFHAVTPHLVVDGAEAAIRWYGTVFGAKELARMPLPNGKLMHATLQLGDSTLMLADPFAGPVPDKMVGVTLHLQRKDLDEVWKRAMDNGASPIMPLADQFWGDRYGQLRDPFGHAWSLGWPANLTAAQKKKMEQDAVRQMVAGTQHP
ncbi:MAG: PhnB protein [Thermoplasmata archaeon]|jgi:PhnB protein|nr:PhnB protein [Thermoplasmata archaeon]